MMLTVKQAADLLRLSGRRVRTLCEQGRIVGAERYATLWLIPHPVTVEPPLRKYRRKSASA